MCAYSRYLLSYTYSHGRLALTRLGSPCERRAVSQIRRWKTGARRAERESEATSWQVHYILCWVRVASTDSQCGRTQDFSGLRKNLYTRRRSLATDDDDEVGMVRGTKRRCALRRRATLRIVVLDAPLCVAIWQTNPLRFVFGDFGIPVGQLPYGALAINSLLDIWLSVVLGGMHRASKYFLWQQIKSGDKHGCESVSSLKRFSSKHCAYRTISSYGARAWSIWCAWLLLLLWYSILKGYIYIYTLRQFTEFCLTFAWIASHIILINPLSMCLH